MDDHRWHHHLPPTRLAILGLLSALFTLTTLFYALPLHESLHYGHPKPAERDCPVQAPPSCPPLTPPTDTAGIELVESMASYFERFRPTGPIADQFGDRGQRAAQLKAWMSFASRLEDAARGRVEVAIERAGPSVFPFLADPPSESPNPLRALRERAVPNTRGIVIPTGTANLRMACHLIGNLLYTHSTTLPIEVAYAGDDDLNETDRDAVASLFPGARLRFLDVLSVFNDSTLALAEGGWAVKPFALLASEFSEVILADADTVFVQRPEAMFEQGGYVEKGALLFHDRLIDKGRYMDRDRWYKQQIITPSGALDDSMVWNEAYAEEADSGVVVADKSKLGVWMGMMHAAWQNSRGVRDEFTYKMTYGDKETWWLGLELTGGEYAFEPYYGGIAGWFGTKAGVVDEAEVGNGTALRNGTTAGVCSFVIAHLDADHKLLWYNGSLLKNKRADLETFFVPTHWMVNGTWDKGVGKQFSCMSGGLQGVVTEAETEVLEHAVGEAKAVDAVLIGPPVVEEVIGNVTFVGNATVVGGPAGNGTTVDVSEGKTGAGGVDVPEGDLPGGKTGTEDAVDTPVDEPGGEAKDEDVSVGELKAVDAPEGGLKDKDVPVEELKVAYAPDVPVEDLKALHALEGGTKDKDVPVGELKVGEPKAADTPEEETKDEDVPVGEPKAMEPPEGESEDKEVPVGELKVAYAPEEDIKDEDVPVGELKADAPEGDTNAADTPAGESQDQNVPVGGLKAVDVPAGEANPADKVVA